ncbi:MAG: hypothetical protein GXO48_02875 [Chlorobi bacterium]|nr:hypothetical protein [Chlorobiota bacterium]
MKEFLDLGMISQICVAIIVAIMGIAYPIIVDKISQIGEKFKSDNIREVLRTEFPHNAILKIPFCRKRISFFEFFLYGSLISMLFLALKLKPLFVTNIEWLDYMIANSAHIVLMIFTVFLVIVFFFWIHKVAIYSGNANDLLKHCIDMYGESTEKKYLLKSINDIALYAMDTQNEHLQKTLVDFYSTIFSRIRHEKLKQGEDVVYPIDLYHLVNRLVERAVRLSSNRLRALEYRAISGIWLIGDGVITSAPISEQTYSWLWRNVYVMISKPRLLKEFWANSYQYFIYALKPITPKIEYRSEKIIVVNKNEIEQRKKEADRFLEFHYALGGLVLYKGHYSLLRYFFEFSHSYPPQYPLLPRTMDEVFYWFDYFYNDLYRLDSIDLRYPFPGLDNLGNSRQINIWICRYIALLFIRQYTLPRYLIIGKPIAHPRLPDKIRDLHRWLNNIEFFKKCLEDILSNERLLEELGYKELVRKKEKEFDQFIRILKGNIQKRIGSIRVKAKLSSEKIKQFYDKTSEIFYNAFYETYSQILKFDSGHDKCELITPFPIDVKVPFPRSAFIEDEAGEIPHLNFDAALADVIVREVIFRRLPLSFSEARTKHYVIREEEIIKAFEHLISPSLNSKVKIIGNNIINRIKTEIKSYVENRHNNVEFIEIPSPLLNVLFILREVDLPNIKYYDPSQEDINKYELKCINEELRLYASVIDLGQEVSMSGNEGQAQDPEVMLIIKHYSELCWKRDRQIVQITISTPYKEAGIPNDISEIQPLRD